MKSFREQFIECSKAKMHGDGPFLKWKDHPELLPRFPKAARAVARVLKKDPEAGLQTIACLRFGGQCSSGHPQCRELRAQEPFHSEDPDRILLGKEGDDYYDAIGKEIDKHEARNSQVERRLCDSSNRDSSNRDRV